MNKKVVISLKIKRDLKKPLIKNQDQIFSDAFRNSIPCTAAERHHGKSFFDLYMYACTYVHSSLIGLEFTAFFLFYFDGGAGGEER